MTTKITTWIVGPALWIASSSPDAEAQGSSPQEPKVVASATFSSSSSSVELIVEVQETEYDLAEMLLFGDGASAPPTASSLPASSHLIAEFHEPSEAAYPPNWREMVTDRYVPGSAYWFAVELVALDGTGDPFSFHYVLELTPPTPVVDRAMNALKGLEVSVQAAFGPSLPGTGEQLLLLYVIGDKRQYAHDWDQIAVSVGTGPVPQVGSALPSPVLTVTSGSGYGYAVAKVPRGSPVWIAADVTLQKVPPNRLRHRQVLRDRISTDLLLHMSDLTRGQPQP
ncbi:MAG: hypothetical protein ACF8XB_02925 [Planctomycetota bacterium JB042]